MEIITLESSDRQTFTVPREIAEMSAFVKDNLEHANTTNLRLSQVSGGVLAKILEWLKHRHALAVPPCYSNKDGRTPDDIIPWDEAFLGAEFRPVAELLKAAYCLQIQPLVDLGSFVVANNIRGKSTEEQRQYFGVENDFTPEEEDAIRRQNELLMGL